MPLNTLLHWKIFEATNLFIHFFKHNTLFKTTINYKVVQLQ